MWVGGIKEHESEVAKLMDEIRRDIKKVLLRSPPPPAATAASPPRLTDYGEDLSEKLDAKTWAKMEANSLHRQGQEIGNKPFEIEEFSFEHVRQKYPAIRDMDLSLRAAIYEHGLDREHVYEVLAIVLRDELMARQEPPD